MMIAINQSQKSSWAMLIAGSTVVVLTSIVMIFALLKGIYSISIHASPAFATLASAVARSIESLYAASAEHAPTLTRWVWDSVAPDLDLNASVFTAENRSLWGLYALMFSGAAVARRALARMAYQADLREWAVRIQLEEQLRQQVRGNRHDSMSGSDSQTFRIPTPKSEWHTTWWGVLALTVVAGVITDLIKVLVGLAKLP